jgi:hypothetical protein
MVGIGNVVFLFGGVYDSAEPASKRNLNGTTSTEAEHVKGAFYVLATFEEPLFLPNWLDLSGVSTLPVLYHHAAAADEESRVFLMQVHFFLFTFNLLNELYQQLTIYINSY